jgi:hypothetical protein
MVASCESGRYFLNLNRIQDVGFRRKMQKMQDTEDTRCKIQKMPDAEDTGFRRCRMQKMQDTRDTKCKACPVLHGDAEDTRCKACPVLHGDVENARLHKAGLSEAKSREPESKRKPES